MARATAAVLSVGASSWVAWPSKPTTPIFTPSGTLSRKALAAVLAASQPVRLDVGGLHRQRRVDGQHDDAVLVGHLVGHGRAGEGEVAATTPSSEHGGGEVAAPAGLVGRHLVEQGDVREAHGVAPAAALHHEVGDDQPERAAGAATGGTASRKERSLTRGSLRSRRGVIGPGPRPGGGTCGRRRSGRGRRPSRGRCAGRGGRRRPRRGGGRSRHAARPRPAAYRSRTLARCVST